jgi:hypothetical protein
MKSFALITEGITDQAALESILVGHYGEEPDFRQIQPPRDATDESRQGGFAGWERVLEFCSLKEFADIFSTNDYAVIQLDTDICEHPNVKVPLTKDGLDIATPELVDAVRNFIISKIDKDIFEACKDKIFFAISVHSLECWLLSAIATRNQSRIKNCEDHLRRELTKKDEKLEKTYAYYQELTRPLDKPKNLLKAKSSSESLSIFLDSLPPDIE